MLYNGIGNCLHVLRGHIGVVRCLSLKGNILISGGDRKRIIVWNIKVFDSGSLNWEMS